MYIYPIIGILIINILMFIIFVFLYRALKKQEILLQQQIELIENFAKKETTENEPPLEEWKTFVFLQALQVRESISKQVSNLHPKAIEDAPVSHGLTDKELAMIFSTQQVEGVILFWKLFHQYVDTYWKTEQGKIKTVFKGAIDIEGSEVHTIQTVSNQLLPKLDRLIKQMKGVEH
ncbi:hypothetical protein BTR23_01145 [Alkalihalophilus pseudofirmus]|nr:hypothetical protein BTR23_01145 [Alkalihalophilus pseudofirmus]